MLIKRGPYGHFAIEKTDSPDNIFEYASKIISRNPGGFFLPCSIDTYPQGTYISFDCSDLKSIEGFVPNTKHKTANPGNNRNRHTEELRRNFGSLLHSFADDLDMLLDLSNIVLDGRYIFTDPAGEELKICYLPLKLTGSVPELRSLGTERMERLLNLPFFDGILTEDEKQELIYSVKQSDEALYLECCNRLTAYSGNEKPRKFRFNMEMIYGASGLVLCPLLYKVAGPVPAVLSLGVTFVSLAKLYKAYRSDDKARQKTEDVKQAEERKQILFSDKEGGQISGTASLKLITPAKGIREHYSILMDKVTIGSDMFLSDIVLESPAVSPIHALIYRSDPGYYISCCTNSGDTYVENKRILSGDKQEIKDGQKITIGGLEFIFETRL